MFPSVTLQKGGVETVTDITNTFNHEKLGFSSSDIKCPIEIEQSGIQLKLNNNPISGSNLSCQHTTQNVTCSFALG